MKEIYITLETALLAEELGYKQDLSTPRYVEGLAHTSYDYHRNLEEERPYEPPSLTFKSKLFDHERVICNAPTQSLLQKWIREEHDIYLTLNPTWEKREYEGKPKWRNNSSKALSILKYDTYEDALEMGLAFSLRFLLNDRKNLNNPDTMLTGHEAITLMSKALKRKDKVTVLYLYKPEHGTLLPNWDKELDIIFQEWVRLCEKARLFLEL